MKRKSLCRISTLTFAGIVAVTTLSGCSRAGNTGAEGDKIEAVKLTRAQFGAELVNELQVSPLTKAVGLLPSNVVLVATGLTDSLEIAVRSCMEQQGFPYEVQLVADNIGDLWLPAVSRDDFAARYGFGSQLDPEVDGSIEGVKSDDPNTEYQSKLNEADSKAWNEALNGVDGVSGCRGDAMSQASGGVMAVLDPLIATANQQVEANADVVAARSEYVRCTTESGIAWMDNPDQARLVGLSYVTENKLSEADEVSAAKAELNCRFKYVGTERSVRAAVESRIVDENAETIASVRAAVEAE